MMAFRARNHLWSSGKDDETILLDQHVDRLTRSLPSIKSMAPGRVRPSWFTRRLSVIVAWGTTIIFAFLFLSNLLDDGYEEDDRSRWPDSFNGLSPLQSVLKSNASPSAQGLAGGKKRFDGYRIENFVTKPLSPELDLLEPFTLGDGLNARAVPFRKYGHNFHATHVHRDTIIPQPGTERLDGNPYNLALLRLPDHLEWQFIGVSRGPQNLVGEGVAAKKVFFQTLLGFGLNLTDNGRFEQVSMATPLHIPTRYVNNPHCDEKYNTWLVRGPEDPRLYWSDLNVPMLSFGMPSTQAGFCRGMWLAPDLRAIWPELGSILGSAKGIQPYRARDREAEVVELSFDETQEVEKNWMAFFPGAQMSGTSHIPLIHYSLNPDLSLHKPEKVYRTYNEQTTIFSYLTLPVDVDAPDSTAFCVAKEHSLKGTSVHGATPFTRLTLCKRGTCTPDEHNTVFVAINHFIQEGTDGQTRYYGRYFTFWNVTSPFQPVAVGPVFHLDVPDDTVIVYVLSLSFVPPGRRRKNYSRWSEHKRRISALKESGSRLFLRHRHHDLVQRTTLKYGPTHGFLDDRIFIGLGIQDRQLASIELTADEMLNRIRSCSRAAPVTFTPAEAASNNAAEDEAVAHDEHDEHDNHHAGHEEGDHDEYDDSEWED